MTRREVDRALAALAEAAKTDANLMEATLVAARAGATTGEWAGTLREVFGEFRAPTGVSGAVGVAEAGQELTEVREQVQADRRGARRTAAAARRQARASTDTPTAPSRSPCAPATPASRWSTRASG